MQRLGVRRTTLLALAGGSGGLCLIAAGLALQVGTRTGRDRRGQSPAADVASLPATS
ncbi:MAG: hypothetical protein ACREMG_04140 [Gemmatimonadales bacterium]